MSTTEINETSRDRYGIEPTVEKIREIRFRWYRYVIRTDGNSLPKIELNIAVNVTKRSIETTIIC